VSQPLRLNGPPGGKIAIPYYYSFYGGLPYCYVSYASLRVRTPGFEMKGFHE
jgi:hypothetical protein